MLVVVQAVTGWFRWGVEGAARGLEAVGVGVIAVGALVATGVFLWRGMESGYGGAVYHGYRANLGRSILLGLEFLVGADIINTVAIDPTLKSVAVLGGIVAIRTFLSFTLEVEIQGKWPWRRGGMGEEVGKGQRDT